MKIVILGLSILVSSFAFSQEPQKKKVVLEKETQIALATHFLSGKEKSEAIVLGYSDSGVLKVLREGDSHLTCVADNPEEEGLEIVCYYTKLEDFMQRGRDLIKDGKSAKEVRELRKTEIESGQLSFPGGPSMLYVFNGKKENVDINAGTIEGGKLRYVIYTPFSTQESTGLPLAPGGKGMPWLMDPGTHRAHIMVSPN